MAEYMVQKAFKKFYPAYKAKHSVTPEQESAAQCIMGCKTGQYGFSKSVCPECGYEVLHYGSCGNRNCPCCQGTKPEEWVEARSSELIDGIPYFHVIMTVPHELNPLFLNNPKQMYSLLLQSTSLAVKEVSSRKENLGAAPGTVSVLHTWGQTLDLHPHVHMLIAGGGLSGRYKFSQCKNSHFFCPEEHLSGSFREHFLSGLKKLRSAKVLSFSGSASELRNSFAWEELLTKLYHIKWNVFVKETFNGNGNAITYLSRYAYRTAISNSRILSVTDEGVTISWKDYRDEGKQKAMTLSGEEFIRRFLMHVLPKGFCRIRYGGYLSNASRKKNLAVIRFFTGAKARVNRLAGMTARQRIKELFNIDICKCPECSAQMNIWRFYSGEMLC